jgi:hypothetical protein
MVCVTRRVSCLELGIHRQGIPAADLASKSSTKAWQSLLGVACVRRWARKGVQPQEVKTHQPQGSSHAGAFAATLSDAMGFACERLVQLVGARFPSRSEPTAF